MHLLGNTFSGKKRYHEQVQTIFITDYHIWCSQKKEKLTTHPVHNGDDHRRVRDDEWNLEIRMHLIKSLMVHLIKSLTVHLIKSLMVYLIKSLMV